MKISFSKRKKGVTLVSVLVLAGVFLVMTQASLGLFLVKHKRIQQKQARVSAFHLAEGSLAYWKWRFAHLPNDPYQTPTIARAVQDFTGKVIGQSSITVNPPSACNSMLTVTARVTPASRSDIQRTVSMQYGKQSLAKYAFLTNSNIWFGGDEQLDGEIFSNGGIRMDAEQNSVAYSARATYQCQPEHGCNPAVTRPGIWGTGAGGARGLWSFPVANIDFETIGLNLENLRATARSANTLLPQSGRGGWRIILEQPNTVRIKMVKSRKSPRWGYNGAAWTTEANDILEESDYKTITIPQNSCGGSNLIVAEDDVWVEGSVNAPLTIVAARFPQVPALYASIYLKNNIPTPADGHTVLALIAQKDILIPFEVPSRLTVDAVLFAVHGHAFRNFYCPPGYLRQFGYPRRLDEILCPQSNVPFHLRDYLELRGSLITNGIAGFTWVQGDITNIVSGFLASRNYFDHNLIFNPPPFLPTLSGLDRIRWQDVTEK